MNRELDFYYDIGSPAAYLAWMRMPELIAKTGVTVNYIPIFISGIFKLTGNDTPITVPAKGKWIFKDFARFAKRDNIPFVVNSQFPMNSLYVMRALAAMQNNNNYLEFATGLYRGMWETDRDLTNLEVVVKIGEEAGINPVELSDKIALPETKQLLIDLTQTAVDRGAFGAPVFFIEDEMHFGQDRMDFVIEDIMNLPE